MVDTFEAKPRILIVDDEPSVRLLLERFIRSAAGNTPHEILGAENGSAAIEKLRATMGRDVALVFTDNLMPGVKGTDLAKTIRGEREGLDPEVVTTLRNVPVVMIASLTKEEDEAAVMDLVRRKVLQKFLDKPARNCDVSAWVRRALEISEPE